MDYAPRRERRPFALPRPLRMTVVMVLSVVSWIGFKEARNWWGRRVTYEYAARVEPAMATDPRFGHLTAGWLTAHMANRISFFGWVDVPGDREALWTLLLSKGPPFPIDLTHVGAPEDWPPAGPAAWPDPP